MYDAEVGFPGLTIDGTACSCNGVEPLPPSESYEDMVAGQWKVLSTIEDSDQDTTRLMLQRRQWVSENPDGWRTLQMARVYRHTIKYAYNQS